MQSNIREITWQPRSPSPKIRSPSVTTMTWMFFSGQFLSTSRILPLYTSAKRNRTIILRWIIDTVYKNSIISAYQKLKEDKGTIEMKLTSLSSLYKVPEDAWRWTHISGKLHQQSEYKQPGVTPQHDQ